MNRNKGGMMGADGNNAKQVPAGTFSRLVLTLQHETFVLQVTGEVVNWNAALAMLAQAEREIKEKIRAEQIAASLALPPGLNLPNLRRNTQ